MSYQPQDIHDLAILIRDRYAKGQGGKAAWSDISMPYRKYLFSKFLDKARGDSIGGKSLKYPVQVSNVETARNTGTYDVDVTAPKSILTEAQLFWSMQTVNYMYDVNEDVFQQGDDVTVVKHLETKLHSAWNAYFALMETNLRGTPTSSTQANPPPCGLRFWFPFDTSNNADGNTDGQFSANLPGSFTDVAGINMTTYEGWRHWAFGYTNVTWDDFVRKVLRACEMTKFMAPHIFPKLDMGVGDNDWMFLTTYNVIEGLRKLLRTSNDDVGDDLSAYDRQLLKSIPIQSWPILEDLDGSTQPIYGVNHNQIKYKYMTGKNQKWSPPIMKPGSHTVFEHHMDNTGRFECYNLREAGFVGSLAA